MNNRACDLGTLKLSCVYKSLEAHVKMPSMIEGSEVGLSLRAPRRLCCRWSKDPAMRRENVCSCLLQHSLVSLK